MTDLTETTEIYRIIADLFAAIEETRNVAVERLIVIGEPAVKPLVSLLQKPGDWVISPELIYRDDWTKRQTQAVNNACQILVAIGPPAIPILETELVCEHKNTSFREIATSILASIGDEQAVSILRTLIYKEITAHKARRKRWLINKIIGIPIVVIISAWFQSKFHFPLQFFIQGCVFGGFVDSAVKLRQSAVSAIAKKADVRMLGALCLCLTDRDKYIRRTASEALIKLLPTVRASDKQYVSPNEMESMVKALGKDKGLTLSILKGLEQIGDEKALSKVEELAEFDRYEVVREAARECLPYLRQRAEEARLSSTLLRASAPTLEIAPDSLLRPAQGVATLEPNQLLRPTQE